MYRSQHPPPAGLDRWSAVAGLVVGVVGGIYGIGGGSVLGPMLVGAGLAMARVGP